MKIIDEEIFFTAKEFVKASGKAINTIYNNVDEIEGAKKIEGRWYFPKYSVKAFTKRKVGAPKGNRSGLKSGGKAPVGAKKILWVSDRSICLREKMIVKKIFGQKTILIENIRSKHQAQTVLNEFKRGDFDEIIVTCFNSMVCQLIELKLKPFFIYDPEKGLAVLRKVKSFKPEFTNKF